MEKDLFAANEFRVIRVFRGSIEMVDVFTQAKRSEGKLRWQRFWFSGKVEDCRERFSSWLPTLSGPGLSSSPAAKVASKVPASEAARFVDPEGSERR